MTSNTVQSSYSNTSDNDKDLDQGKFVYSRSVEKVLEIVSESDNINAIKMVNAILDLGHRKKFAGGLLADLTLDETKAKTNKTAEDWIAEIKTLFNPERAKELLEEEKSRTGKHPLGLSSSDQPELHGQLVIFGLCLLEESLRAQLENNSAFSILEEKINPPVYQFMTKRAEYLYEHRVEPTDIVSIWPDDAVMNPEDDILGRYNFARYLAEHIKKIPERSGAYPIHLYAPWGAGKSSLLNFLEKELEGEKKDAKWWIKIIMDIWRFIVGIIKGIWSSLKKLGNQFLILLKIRPKEEKKEKKKTEWKVIKFNAWRHQHIQNPWWSMMDIIYKRTRKDLSFQNRWAEKAWRLNTGSLPLIATVIILVWVLVILQPVLINLLNDEEAVLPSLAELADNVSTIIALITTVGGTILAVNRSLIFGSTKAAENYIQLSRDPMNEIRRRFEKLIARNPKRVAVFIDDLDRCQSTYVINLLEGVQTLFRNAPVVFVVAADRRWLYACYEEVYKNLDHQVHEAGKSLGILFLEKAFRSSIPVPGVPEKLKKDYWLYLIEKSSKESGKKPFENEKKKRSQERKDARNKVKDKKSANALREVVLESKNQDVDPHVQSAIRGEVAVQLATSEVMASLEHNLKPYVEFIEPNPRTMKRLVNTYSANTAINILTYSDIGTHQLILWTILSFRWPRLVELLTDSLEMFKETSKVPTDLKLTKELKEYFEDNEVIRILEGGPKPSEPLTIETIEKCIQMQA